MREVDAVVVERVDLPVGATATFTVKTTGGASRVVVLWSQASSTTWTGLDLGAPDAL